MNRQGCFKASKFKYICYRFDKKCSSASQISILCLSEILLLFLAEINSPLIGYIFSRKGVTFYDSIKLQYLNREDNPGLTFVENGLFTRH